MLVISVEFNTSGAEFLSSEISTVKISFTNADAQSTGGFEMTEQTCWETGEQIQICRAADWFCDVGGQDTCGPDPNPGEG